MFILKCNHKILGHVDFNDVYKCRDVLAYVLCTCIRRIIRNYQWFTLNIKNRFARLQDYIWSQQMHTAWWKYMIKVWILEMNCTKRHICVSSLPNILFILNTAIPLLCPPVSNFPGVFMKYTVTVCAQSCPTARQARKIVTLCPVPSPGSVTRSGVVWTHSCSPGSKGPQKANV